MIYIIYCWGKVLPLYSFIRRNFRDTNFRELVDLQIFARKTFAEYYKISESFSEWSITTPKHYLDLNSKLVTPLYASLGELDCVLSIHTQTSIFYYNPFALTATSINPNPPPHPIRLGISIYCKMENSWNFLKIEQLIYTCSILLTLNLIFYKGLSNLFFLHFLMPTFWS